MIEKALHEKLSSITQPYPVFLPQNVETPALTYQRISDVPAHHLSGSTITGSRFQVDCWGDTYDQVKGIAADIRGALDGFRGEVAGVHFSALVLSSRDLYEEGAMLRRVSLDISIWHRG